MMQSTLSFAAVDVFYDEPQNLARSGCVLFSDPTADEVIEEAIAVMSPVAPYQPGQFYRRELPALEAVLRQMVDRIDIVLVDGYVWLSKDGRPGLGWHVHERFSIPVIGIAKTRFRDADNFAELVYRGSSKQPLYVTQIGYEGSTADLVAQMHGANRIPTLLRRVDRLARGG